MVATRLQLGTTVAVLIIGVVTDVKWSLDSNVEHYRALYIAAALLFVDSIAAAVLFARTSKFASGRGKAGLLAVFALAICGVIFSVAQLWLPFALASGVLPPW
jgi:lysylphosphatidylglycerol synthetase-like protein (DUF2156 family)